jgi:diguanylate cyclase (GGDEF)-like protein
MSRFSFRGLDASSGFTKSMMEPVRQTLLLVDDNEGSLKALMALFEDDYRVLSSSNPVHAIRLAQTQDVDLILLDVEMPVMDGYEVCKNLKRNRRTRDIPVIFVTGLSSREEESKGLAVGAVDYISKPYHSSIIQARVNNHMQLVQYRKTLQALSHTDVLTGLPNRRQLEDVIKREWHSAIRSEHDVAFLFIDIDNFKSYNDLHGHVAGDACLKSVANVLEMTRRRENDFLARYGGEEFVAVLPNASKHGAKQIAVAMLKAVRQMNLEHSGNEPYNIVTVSIGLSWYSPLASTQDYITNSCDELLRRADQQLYQAKRRGRNRVAMDFVSGTCVN